MVVLHNFKWQHIIGEPDLIDPEAGRRLFFYRRVPLSLGKSYCGC